MSYEEKCDQYKRRAKARHVTVSRDLKFQHLNINIKVNFYKTKYTLIKNNIVFINIRYYSLFFFNF